MFKVIDEIDRRKYVDFCGKDRALKVIIIPINMLHSSIDLNEYSIAAQKLLLIKLMWIIIGCVATFLPYSVFLSLQRKIFHPFL